MRVPGTVVRNVFLGSTRDYIVEAKDGTQLRITAPAGGRFRRRRVGVADAAAGQLPRLGRLASDDNWRRTTWQRQRISRRRVVQGLAAASLAGRILSRAALAAAPAPARSRRS